MLEILLTEAAVTITVLVLLTLLAAGIALYFVSVRNDLRAQRNSVDKALFEVEILLKQRHDELPKLVGTCRSYMLREQKCFEAVTAGRAAYGRAKTLAEKAEADEMITGAVLALLAAADKYPDLKTNSNFIQLRSRLAALEQKVAAQRIRYNEDVNALNARIGRVPEKLVASFMNLQPLPLFPSSASHGRHIHTKSS